METYGGYDLRTLGAITPRVMAVSKHDLGSVDPHFILMSLRSGLLLAQSWALNQLTVLANDSLVDFPVSHLHPLINALVDILTLSLTLINTPPAGDGGGEECVPTVHDLLAYEYEQFSSLLQSDHRLHNPSTVVNHHERALCIENILRGLSFSEIHAGAMMVNADFVPALVAILTRHSLEHRKNGMVLLSNVAGKLTFASQQDAERVLTVLSDCILTQVDADRSYCYFPHPTAGQHSKLPAHFAGNPAIAMQHQQQVINAYTYFNWDPFYFSSSALETLVQLSLLNDNRILFSQVNLGILAELIHRLSLLVLEELEDLEDVDTAEMSLVILSNFSNLTDPIRLLVASQPGLMRSLVRFARFPVLLMARDESDQRQNMNIMRYAAQALLGISHSPEGQAFIKDHELSLLEAVCERSKFAPLLSEILFNISKGSAGAS